MGELASKPDFELRARIHECLVRGGYIDKLGKMGADYARVQEFFARVGTEDWPSGSQRPWLFPMFPGLDHQPFHEADAYPEILALEASAAIIRKEAESIQQFAAYDGGLSEPGDWSVYPFYTTGVDMQAILGLCPETHRIVKGLHGHCFADYPFGDFIFSVHRPGTHLVPHCSVDNLRLRCHLGLVVPKGTSIRVDAEERSWHEGKALVFEDSYEHEVWNRGDSRRIVLIVDFWHPSLTEPERRALSAAFMKAEVRSIVSAVRNPPPTAAFIEPYFAESEADPRILEFWR